MNKIHITANIYISININVVNLWRLSFETKRRSIIFVIMYICVNISKTRKISCGISVLVDMFFSFWFWVNRPSLIVVHQS